jgi:hypothetical protein
LVSYPAGFLGGVAVLQYLYQSSAITKVADIFTYKENTIDLISVPGTVLSQKGSSGGAVIDENGSLIGLISTSGEGEQTKERDLRAITGAYINRDLKRVINIDLSGFLSNIDQIFTIFKNETEPILSKIIKQNLNN